MMTFFVQVTMLCMIVGVMHVIERMYIAKGMYPMLPIVMLMIMMVVVEILMLFLAVECLNCLD